MLKIEGLEDRIYEDVRAIEKCYYDPHEEDEGQIRRMLHKISGLLDQKREEYEQTQEKYDKRTEAMRGLAVDLAMLRKQKDQIEATNTQLGRKLEAIQNVDDINIQIDILSNTKEGTFVLREKYAKLQKKFYLEREAHEAYEQKYGAQKSKLKELEAKKAEICHYQKAMEEQKFHILRAEEQLSRLKASQDTIKSHEHIIASLSEQIKNASGSGPKNTAELKTFLSDLRYK